MSGARFEIAPNDPPARRGSSKGEQTETTVCPADVRRSRRET